MNKLDSTWLTLTQASELLGVHPTTLRSWVDAGLVRAFLTPGGHRRFRAAELRDFLEQQRAHPTSRSFTVAPDQTLDQVRQQLSTVAVSSQVWYRRLSGTQQAQQRENGRRLLGLLLQFVSRQENADQYLDEARELVKGYGQDFRRTNSSVTELAHAFLFFRRTVVNATYLPHETIRPGDSEGMRLLQRINLFMDELLLATLEGFESAGDALALPPHASSGSEGLATR